MQITINRRFLYKLRPEKMVLFAILFWIFCYVFSPVEPKESLSLKPMTYIGMCLFFFWIGTLLIKHKKDDTVIEVTIKDNILCRLYNITFILGAIGVAFKYYDTFYLRRASLLFSENGELFLAEGGNIFSILSGMLIFFSYIPITFDQLCPRLHGRLMKVISLIIFILTALTAVITGSRFAIILPSIYYIIMMLYTRKMKFKVTFRNVIISIVILLSSGFVIGGLFLSRLDLQGRDGTDAATGDGYARLVPVSTSYKKWMNETRGSILYTYLFAYSNVVQYELHAVYEFPSVMEAIDKKGDFFYGQATLSVFMKFIYKVIRPDYNLTADILKHNPHPGIWSTFFYQWYLDFWWFGVLLMFIMGFISKLLWKSVYMGGVYYLPLLLYVSIIWLLVLNLNLISGAGSYAIFSFTIFSIVLRRQLLRRIRLRKNLRPQILSLCKLKRINGMS